jgi:hypothetical protein
MTTETLHPLASEYLQRLRRAGRHLPPERLGELLTEIQGHLAEAIDPDATNAQALTILERLGDPDTIIAAEDPNPDRIVVARGPREWAAMTLLLIGGFIFGIGWIVGLVLLWGSRAWNTRDKWIGTLFIPGGLATSALISLALLGTPTASRCEGYADGPLHCTSTTGPTILPTALAAVIAALLLIAPVITAIYLTRRSA